MSDLKAWQTRKNLSDSDILSDSYLERIKLEPSLVQCACGCGEWRSRFDKYGTERRYIRGHGNRGRKLSAETIRKMRESRHKNRHNHEKNADLRRLKRKYGKRQFEKLKMLFSNKEEA